MLKARNTAFVLISVFFMLSLTSCQQHPSASKHNPIVGTWLVKDAGAPFPYHMYVFNADGTMQQANPDAGDPKTSDSDGKGVWVLDGSDGKIKGRWMEIYADRTTHKFAGRLELSFWLKADSENFTGTYTVRTYDAALDGKRVTAP